MSWAVTSGHHKHASSAHVHEGLSEVCKTTAGAEGEGLHTCALGTFFLLSYHFHKQKYKGHGQFFHSIEGSEQRLPGYED